MNTNFIKLTSTVINKLHIAQIVSSTSKYHIYMNTTPVSGYNLFLFGNISRYHNMIEVCEKKNKVDYYIIKEFIKQL